MNIMITKAAASDSTHANAVGNGISFPNGQSQISGDPEQSKVIGASFLIPCGTPKDDVEDIEERRTEDQSSENRSFFVRIAPTKTANRKNYPREYRSWDNTKQRCRIQRYVLDPRFVHFSDFLFHMGEQPAPTYTLDKIDPSNPEYSPDSCRWASKKLQTSNRRTTRYLVDNSGTRLSSAEWSRRTDISTKTILGRIDRGWSEHEAIHTPLRQPRKSKEAKFSNPETAAGTKEAIALWRQILRNEHGQEFYSTTNKDAGMLKQLLGRVEDESPGNSIDFLERVLTEWGAFCLYAESEYGAFGSPSMPTIEYLTKYCNAAGNWYLKQDKKRRSKEVRCPQPEKERPHDEHRESFIRNYLHANDEYRHLSQLFEMIDSGKNDGIEGLVTDEMRRAFRDGWWAMLCGGSGGNSSLESKDLAGVPAKTIAQRYFIDDPDKLPMLEQQLRVQAEEMYLEKYPQNSGVNQQL